MWDLTGAGEPWLSGMWPPRDGAAAGMSRPRRPTGRGPGQDRVAMITRNRIVCAFLGSSWSNSPATIGATGGQARTGWSRTPQGRHPVDRQLDGPEVAQPTHPSREVITLVDHIRECRSSERAESGPFEATDPGSPVETSAETREGRPAGMGRNHGGPGRAHGVRTLGDFLCEAYNRRLDALLEGLASDRPGVSPHPGDEAAPFRRRSREDDILLGEALRRVGGAVCLRKPDWASFRDRDEAYLIVGLTDGGVVTMQLDCRRRALDEVPVCADAYDYAPDGTPLGGAMNPTWCRSGRHPRRARIAAPSATRGPLADRPGEGAEVRPEGPRSSRPESVPGVIFAIREGAGVAAASRPTVNSAAWRDAEVPVEARSHEEHETRKVQGGSGRRRAIGAGDGVGDSRQATPKGPVEATPRSEALMTPPIVATRRGSAPPGVDEGLQALQASLIDQGWPWEPGEAQGGPPGADPAARIVAMRGIVAAHLARSEAGSKLYGFLMGLGVLVEVEALAPGHLRDLRHRCELRGEHEGWWSPLSLAKGTPGRRACERIAHEYGIEAGSIK